jgi:hypothetical protein
VSIAPAWHFSIARAFSIDRYRRQSDEVLQAPANDGIIELVWTGGRYTRTAITPRIKITGTQIGTYFMAFLDFPFPVYVTLLRYFSSKTRNQSTR